MCGFNRIILDNSTWMLYYLIMKIESNNLTKTPQAPACTAQENEMQGMKIVSKGKTARIVTAMKEARRLHENGTGSFYGNLKAAIGEPDADLAMMNLMWADSGFAGAPKR